MLKITNRSTGNKRIRLTALDSAMSNIDDSVGAVAKDGNNVLLCLAPDKSSDPSNIIGVALGNGMGKLMGAFMVKKEWNANDDIAEVAIYPKDNPELKMVSQIYKSVDVPNTDYKITVVNFNVNLNLENAVHQVDSLMVEFLISGSERGALVEWTGDFSSTTEPRRITTYDEDEVNVIDSAMSVQVAEDQLLPDAIYGDAYYLPQDTDDGSIRVLEKSSEEMVTRLTKTYNEKDSTYGSVAEVGMLWGDRRDGAVWDRTFGYTCAVFGKVNDKHTGILHAVYVW